MIKKSRQLTTALFSLNWDQKFCLNQYLVLLNNHNSGLIFLNKSFKNNSFYSSIFEVYYTNKKISIKFLLIFSRKLIDVKEHVANWNYKDV
jgi:hypothetical protein